MHKIITPSPRLLTDLQRAPITIYIKTADCIRNPYIVVRCFEFLSCLLFELIRFISSVAVEKINRGLFKKRYEGFITAITRTSYV